MAGLFESLVPGAVTAAAGVGMAKDITQSGAEAAAAMNTLGDQLQTDTRFKPYSVSTGFGTTEVDRKGGMEMTGISRPGFHKGMTAYGAGLEGMQAGMDAVAMGNAQLDQANTMLTGAMGGMDAQKAAALGASQELMDRSMMDTAQREAKLFDQMQAAQQPALNRARAAMESRAHAQGRGGIIGNQFGGSGEQFAQSKAEAEARNSAMLQAGQLARQEQMQQGQLASQYGGLGNAAANTLLQGANARNQYGYMDAQLQNQGAQLGSQIAGQMAGLGLQGAEQSYLPFQHQLQASQLGMQNANLAQTGQIAGANLAGQLGLGGIQAEVNAQKAASELYGNMFGALASPLSSLGQALDEDGLGGLWDSVKGIFGG